MTLSQDLTRAVRARAQGRCQYCQMHESPQGATFHIEHVMPRSHGGLSVLENLALACPRCNLHKASNILGIDPLDGEESRLFHPILQRWTEHFQIAGYEIEGVAPIGRATAEMLHFNHPRRVRIREVEEMIGLYPPIL